MTETSAPSYPLWSNPKRFIALWFACYLLLNIFPYPVTIIHGINFLMLPYLKFITSIVIWTGKNVLNIRQLDGNFGGFGNQDTPFGYVQLFAFCLLSLLITTLVFLFIRNKEKYNRIFHWVVVYLRYALALYMLEYGLMKLVMDEGQFIFPSVGTLEQSVGSLSPMGLLWASMGYSQPYEIFTGLAEILGGYLLFFNKTKTLGSLILIGVMSNVTMMEFCYDINLKLFSIHLLLIAFLILLPDVRRIVRFFLFHTSVSLTSTVTHYDKRWMRISRIVLKTFIIIGFTVLYCYYFRQYPSAPKSALYGAYDTKGFIVNSDSVNIPSANLVPWKKLIIDNDYNYSQIITIQDSATYYQATVDTIKKTLILTLYNDTSKKYQFTYLERPDNYLEISGNWQGDDVDISFKKKNIQSYTLTKRGFHWTSEYPYIGRNIIDGQGH